MLSPTDMQRLAHAYINEVWESDNAVGNIVLGSARVSRAAEIDFRERLSRNLIDAHFCSESVLDAGAIREIASTLGISLSEPDERSVGAQLNRELAVYQARRARSLRQDQQFTRSGVFRSVLAKLGLRAGPDEPADIAATFPIDAHSSASLVAAPIDGLLPVPWTRS